MHKSPGAITQHPNAGEGDSFPRVRRFYQGNPVDYCRGAKDLDRPALVLPRCTAWNPSSLLNLLVDAFIPATGRNGFPFISNDNEFVGLKLA